MTSPTLVCRANELATSAASSGSTPRSTSSSPPTPRWKSSAKACLVRRPRLGSRRQLPAVLRHPQQRHHALGRRERAAQLYLKPAGYTGNDPARRRIRLQRPHGRRKGGSDPLPARRPPRRPARLTLGTSRSPNYVTLADRYEGKRFNSPNDAVVDSSGAIYFTDPPYGLEKDMDDPDKELVPRRLPHRPTAR